MDEIIINIDNVYSSCDSLFSEIYISSGAIDFPDHEWVDFTYRILIDWAEKIIPYQFEKNADFRLYFIEGNSYRLDIHKQNEMLAVRCIEYDGCREVCLYEIEVLYTVFLKALSKAFSKFAYLLYERDSFDGEFDSVCKELTKYKNVINKIVKETGNVNCVLEKGENKL